MKKIRAAVVGVGNMGQNHARIYSEIGDVELVAVCDLDKKKAEEIAAKHHTQCFRNYRKLLNFDPKIDIVSIATPNESHPEIACFFLKNKVNVLVEKPIANTVALAKKIINTAKDNRVKLAVGHVERFNPAVIALKKLIKKGQLGEIISVITRRVGVFPPIIKDANVFLDLAVHDVDIVTYLLDEKPHIIYKHSNKFHSKNQEDAGEILLIFKKAAAFIQINWVTPVKIRTLMITGKNGYAELDYISQELILHQTKLEEDEKKIGLPFSEFLRLSKPTTQKIRIRKQEPLKLEIKSFVDCVRKNKEPLVNGEAALEILEICLKEGSVKV